MREARRPGAQWEESTARAAQAAVNNLRKAEQKVARLGREKTDKATRFAAYEKEIRASFAAEEKRYHAIQERLSDDLAEAHKQLNLAKEASNGSGCGRVQDSAYGHWQWTRSLGNGPLGTDVATVGACGAMPSIDPELLEILRRYKRGECLPPQDSPTFGSARTSEATAVRSAGGKTCSHEGEGGTIAGEGSKGTKHWAQLRGCVTKHNASPIIPVPAHLPGGATYGCRYYSDSGDSAGTRTACRCSRRTSRTFIEDIAHKGCREGTSGEASDWGHLTFAEIGRQKKEGGRLRDGPLSPKARCSPATCWSGAYRALAGHWTESSSQHRGRRHGRTFGCSISRLGTAGWLGDSRQVFRMQASPRAPSGRLVGQNMGETILWMSLHNCDPLGQCSWSQVDVCAGLWHLRSHPQLKEVCTEFWPSEVVCTVLFRFCNVSGTLAWLGARLPESFLPLGIPPLRTPVWGPSRFALPGSLFPDGFISVTLGGRLPKTHCPYLSRHLQPLPGRCNSCLCLGARLPEASNAMAFFQVLSLECSTELGGGIAFFGRRDLVRAHNMCIGCSGTQASQARFYELLPGARFPRGHFFASPPIGGLDIRGLDLCFHLGARFPEVGIPSVPYAVLGARFPELPLSLFVVAPPHNPFRGSSGSALSGRPSFNGFNSVNWGRPTKVHCPKLPWHRGGLTMRPCLGARLPDALTAITFFWGLSLECSTKFGVRVAFNGGRDLVRAHNMCIGGSGTQASQVRLHELSAWCFKSKFSLAVPLHFRCIGVLGIFSCHDPLDAIPGARLPRVHLLDPPPTGLLTTQCHVF